MLEKMKKILYLITHPRLLKTLLGLPWNSYLKDEGWINAFNKKVSIDLNGNPIPWITYPLIDFIQERLNKNLRIFEYGSGYSTLFYAQRVNSVTTVEHDKNWYNKVKNMVPGNVYLFHCELTKGGQYSKFIGSCNINFDMVIIDGRDRVNCIKNSINYLSDIGVVILDNSDREEYKDAIDFLFRNDFKKIDFWGIAAGYTHKTCSTIFYKPNNCLNI